LLVGFEEKSAAVRWQVETLLNELKSAPVRAATEIPDTSVLSALTQLQLQPESRFIGKRSVLPSKLAEAVTKLPASAVVHAHALNGVIWIHADDSLPEGAVIRRCPAERKKSLPVWGTPSSGWELMRHVKKTLDPDNVFNPG